MSDQPFMQLYVADYLGDTQHLTTEQHGAYLLILMTMWRHDCRLLNDDSKLARIARVSPRRWHLIRDDVMAFFTIDGDFITQKRLEREHQKAVSKSEKRSEAGKLGGRAKSLKNNKVDLANASNLLKHLPETRDQISERDRDVVLSDSVRADESVAQVHQLPHRIRKDWVPSSEDRMHAELAGFTQDRIEAEAASFRDHWLADATERATKADWSAAWRSWLRRANKYEKSAPAQAISPPISKTDRTWRTRFASFCNDGFWAPNWGPLPGRKGFNPACSKELFDEWKDQVFAKVQMLAAVNREKS